MKNFVKYNKFLLIAAFWRDCHPRSAKRFPMPCFVMQYLVSLLVLQLFILPEEERAGCFSSIVFLLSRGCVRCRGLVCSV